MFLVLRRGMVTQPTFCRSPGYPHGAVRVHYALPEVEPESTVFHSQTAHPLVGTLVVALVPGQPYMNKIGPIPSGSVHQHEILTIIIEVVPVSSCYFPAKPWTHLVKPKNSNHELGMLPGFSG